MDENLVRWAQRASRACNAGDLSKVRTSALVKIDIHEEIHGQGKGGFYAILL
jgi:hypothetical protein